MKIKNQGFDHVEFVVNDIGQHAKMYQSMGFEKIGSRKLNARGLSSEVYAQGLLRIILTQYDESESAKKEEGYQFLKRHGDGICVLAVDVEDATLAYEETTKRGARSALEPVKYETENGTVIRSEIWTPEDVRYAFIQRVAPSGPDSPALFDEGLTVSRLKSPAPLNIQLIDHLTNNVQMGDLRRWVDYYDKVFGFIVTRKFDIRTGRTGLLSEVVQSADGKIKVPINEATEKESQVQEFVERFKGPGVQHLALLTTGIIDTISILKNKKYEFLKVPHTYYEMIPKRVPSAKEDLSLLEELSLLLDGDESGYLLQIFTAETVGPFFFEFIQRKGNKGFGEGNFRALFEAIERDQIKRGVLK